jgi:hypothetical protein
MSVRTPDPNSGWLGDDELAAIRLRLGRDPYDETPLLSVNNIPSGVVLVFGVVAFVASTGLSLVSAVSRSSAAA